MILFFLPVINYSYIQIIYKLTHIFYNLELLKIRILEDYNFLLRKNLNSYESVQNFLKNFSKNVTLIKGNSNIILRNLDLKDIDFVFLDGGHSFETVFDDLNLIYKKISSNKGAVILCDDYEDATYITGVKKAVDKFVEINKLKLILIKKRFAKIII